MKYTTIASIVHDYIDTTMQVPFFISDWNSSDDTIYRPTTILKESILKSIDHIDNYYFIEDSYGKEVIVNFFLSNQYLIDQKDFLIGPNASLMLVASLVALKISGISKILIILPVYFSVPEVLDILNIDYITYNTTFPHYELDFNDIKKIIEDQSVDTIFLTDPFYGSGINVPLTFYKKIIDYANDKNIYIVVDYARGGLKWETNTTALFDFVTYSCIRKAKNFIFIESISKRIFVNGFKSSLLFSNDNIINIIMRLGDSFVGSISASQMEFIKHLYSETNCEHVDILIKKNIYSIINNYNIIKTLLLGTNIKYTVPHDGNYMLIGIPKECYGNAEDIVIFKEILYRYNIYTLPQPLYALENPNYYIFRVNLLHNIEYLVDAIIKLTTN